MNIFSVFQLSSEWDVWSVPRWHQLLRGCVKLGQLFQLCHSAGSWLLCLRWLCHPSPRTTAVSVDTPNLPWSALLVLLPLHNHSISWLLMLPFAPLECAYAILDKFVLVTIYLYHSLLHILYYRLVIYAEYVLLRSRKAKFELIKKQLILVRKAVNLLLHLCTWIPW